MRAVLLESFGGPDVLQVGELPDPVVGPDAVLVRVRAAGMNPVDTKIRQGYLQGAYPWAFPLVPGWDVAGVVAQVGPAVSEFAPGDEVMGYVRKDHVQHGAFAELVAAHPRHLARKPVEASFEQAAGLPLAGLTALQALDAARVTGGDTVLVHAAAGGVGSFAVQIARSRGARVVGTASEGNHEYLRGLGAEPVLYSGGVADRVRAAAPDGVDAVIDLVGGEALEQSPSLVADVARVVSVIDPATVLGLGGTYVFVRPDAGQLGGLADMVDEGRLRTEVAATFALDRAADAHRLVEEGHVRGKVVVTI